MPMHPPPTPATAGAAATTHTYRGTAVTMRYGQVQVTITVSGKKVTKVTATAPTESARSAFINQQAVPLLDSEALKAQSATINLISGATFTSGAFASSLSSALRTAHV